MFPVSGCKRHGIEAREIRTLFLKVKQLDWFSGNGALKQLNNNSPVLTRNSQIVFLEDLTQGLVWPAALGNNPNT